MAGYKVTPGELKTGAGNLKAVAGRIEQELGNARKEVTRLVGGGWEGAGSDRFRDLMAEWDKVAIAQQTNLDQVSKALDTAGDNYERAEDAAKQSFSG